MLLSPALALILAIATLAVSGWTIVIAWQQFGLRKEYESHLLHLSSHQAELELLIENQLQMLDSQEKVEDTIHLATTTMQTLHKGIATIPFGILEAIPTTRHTTKVVRVTHDLISDMVYGSIKVANKTSGKILRRGLGHSTIKEIGKPIIKGIETDDK